MSYDGHLISMAGGDGEPDLNAFQAIPEAAVDAAAKFLLDDNPFNDEDDLWQVPSIRDHCHTVARGALEAAHPALLALVREQQAKLDAYEKGLGEAEDLKLNPERSTTPHCIEEYNGGLTNAIDTIRAAITATEGAQDGRIALFRPDGSPKSVDELRAEAAELGRP